METFMKGAGGGLGRFATVQWEGSISTVMLLYKKSCSVSQPNRTYSIFWPAWLTFTLTKLDAVITLTISAFFAQKHGL